MTCKLSILISLLLFSEVVRSQPENYVHTFSWMPNSRKIIYSREIVTGKNITSDVYIINVDGKNNTKLISGGSFPACSPDGTTFAFSQETVDGFEIFTAQIDGSNRNQITRNKFKDIEATFSPDGKKIYYSSNPSGYFQIYVMNRDGSEQRQLINSPSIGCYAPSISKDDNRLVYYKDKGDRMDKVYLFDIQKKQESLLTSDTLHNFYPSWFSENLVLFTSTFKSERDFTQTGLFIMDSKGRQKRTFHGVKGWYARVSPDGKKIAFIKNSMNGSELFIINVKGGEANQITGL